MLGFRSLRPLTDVAVFSLLLLAASRMVACGSTESSGSPSRAGAGGDAGAGGSAGAGAGGEGGQPFVLDGRRDFEIELDATVTACTPGDPSEQRGWLFVGQTNFNDAVVDGFLALSGVRLDDGTVGRYTVGSSSFEGTLEGATARFTVELLYEEGGPPFDLIEATFELEFARDGTIRGSAEGTWLEGGGDFRCDRPFTASVTGGPDETPPSAVAWQDESFPLFPFDAVAGYLTEPVVKDGVQVAASIDGEPAAAVLSWVDDAEQRPREFRVAPAGSWPAGSELTLSLSNLRDATGNHADVELGPFALPEVPPSAQNLGFEAGLEEWLTDPTSDGIGTPPVRALASLRLVDDAGDEFTVNAPEGSLMAYIDAAGMRLVGHLVPAGGESRLELTLAVLDPTLADLKDYPAGFLISVFAGDELTVIGDAEDLPAELPDARGQFSGFLKLSLPLPPSAAAGFWLIVEPAGYAPPVHLPSLLLDDVRLR